MIVISSLDYYKDMKQQLLDSGIDEKYIINIADFSGPMYHNQYFDLQQLKPVDNEVFLDVGSYDGSTSVLFIEWNASKNAKIYAFEPDKDNIAKCNDNLQKCKCWTKLIKAGCWSKTTQLKFKSDGSCASKMDENGNMIVAWIDNFSSKYNYDYIRIESVEKIQQYKYDHIFVAALRKHTINELINTLNKYNIDNRKIICMEPQIVI